MARYSSGALYQGFLPPDDNSQSHVWKFSWEHGGRRPRHFHAESELNLVVAGTAMFGVGQAKFIASAGDLLGFAPGQDHILLDSSPDLYLFAIGVDEKISRDILRNDPVGAALPTHTRLGADAIKALTKRAEVIVDQTGVDRLGAELWEHAYWVRRRAAECIHAGWHVLTRKAFSLMSEVPLLSRDDLARHLRAPPSSISRYFHHDLGLPLVQYRTRLRLLRYIDLFDRGRGNLTTAATAAGFGSYSQCHRAFQAELGCSPRQFLVLGTRDRMQLAYLP